MASADAPAAAALDASFLRFARERDAHALEHVLSALADRCYTQARRIVGDQHLAEEAVQEAWMRLVATAARYDGTVPVAAWLARLVAAAAIDQRRAARRRRRRQEIAMPDLPARTSARDDDALAAVRDAVGDLPERYRQPILLHYFAGLTQEEAARALGVPPGTVAARLSRGRERLRERLCRAGAALTAAVLIELLTAQPTYAAPPTLVSAAQATSAAAAAGKLVAASAPAWLAAASVAGLAAVAALTATFARPGIARASSPPSEILLRAGDDLQAAVDAHPPGTRFRLDRGTWRMQQVAPKDGDAFVGDGDAVLDGTRDLDGFVADGAHWRLDGVDAHGQRHGKALDDHPAAPLPEELFVDGRRLEPVRALVDLRPGAWFLDYDARALHLADDPRGHAVALAVARHAFAGDAVDVTLCGLVVQRYAIPAQMGAIGDQRGVRRWTIERCVVRDNHGTGIVVGDGCRVVDCLVEANGQKGIGGFGAGVLIERCRVLGNNVAGFDPSWEAGGAKFGRCDGLAIVGCRFAGNRGAGVLVESSATGTRIVDCEFTDNALQGVALVSAAGGTIERCLVVGNGAESEGWGWGAQILLRDARGIVVRGNRVLARADGADGIVLMHQRDDGGEPTVDDEVVGNVVVLAGRGGLTGAITDCGFADLFRRNRFAGNRYVLGDPAEAVFAWAGGPLTWDAFRAAGNDVDGAVSRGTELPIDR